MICGGEKIQFFLKKEFEEILSVSTIYRILRKKYEFRSKWKKNLKRGKPFITATRPREVIQTDTVDFGHIFAYTAIDIYTKETSVVLKTKFNSSVLELV